MKRTLPLALSLALLGLLSRTAHAALAENSTVVAPSGGQNEGGYTSALIDVPNNFIAFGSSSSYVVGTSTLSAISEFRTPPSFPFAHIGFKGSFNKFNDLGAGIFDPGTGFSFWTSSNAPSGLFKVHLTNPISASSTTLPVGLDFIRTAVIDPVNGFGYFGTQTSPSGVAKIRLSDMVMISSITLPAGLELLSASVIDTAGGFAYFASSTTTGAVARIRLSDFTLDGTLPFNPGEGAVGSAVIDVLNQFAYFGTRDSPGKIVQVRLSNLSRVGPALMLQPGENDLTSAVADPARGFAYFGTNTSSGIVVQVTLTNLVERSAKTLKAGEDFLRSAVIDTNAGYAYFGTFTTPGRAVQMDLLSGPPDILLQPTDASAHPGESATFSIKVDGRNLSFQWQENGQTIAGATSAAYSRTVSTVDDQSTFQCVVTNDKGSVTSRSVTLTVIPVVRAYPNPWRPDRYPGVNAITFDGLLPNSTVKIFTLSAHWIKTLPLASGTATWDRTNDAGQSVASGYYVYLVTTGRDKQNSHGMLAIIK